ncbi:MAG: hypothetical protein RIS64_1336 [Bacteroidota bacterium]|jgi:hypothetical protein
MKKLSFLGAFFLMQINLFAQSPETPTLEFVCELNVLIDKALVVGETAHGTRRIVPIKGGTFKGPKIKGEIINGGADWQVVRADGVTEVEAHYDLRTDDSTVIYIKNVGLRVATPEVAARIAKGEKVSPTEYCFRTVLKFEAPKNSKYDWLNNAIFICKAIRMPDYVAIQVWKVL